MENKIVKTSIVYWCPSYDRHIYIEKKDSQIIGFDFFQGDTETEFFGIDSDLSNFYHSIKHLLNGVNELDNINQCIRMYLNFEEARHKVALLFMEQFDNLESLSLDALLIEYKNKLTDKQKDLGNFILNLWSQEHTE